MAKFGISPQGADELLKLSEKLKMIVSDNEKAGTTLFKEISSYSEKLGVYDSEIKKLAYESIETSIKANDDINYLSKKIMELSSEIQSLLSFSLVTSNNSSQDNYSNLEKFQNGYSNLENTSGDNSKAFQALVAYMSEKNYGIDDFDTYSQDPQWIKLHNAAYPDYETTIGSSQDGVQKNFYNEYADYKTGIIESHKLDRNYDIQSLRDSRDLTLLEKNVLERYSGLDYKNINKYLYDPDFRPINLEQGNQIKKDIEILTECIARKRIPYDSRTYRGIDNMSIIFGDDFNTLSISELNSKYSGKFFVNEGFTSASTKAKVADSFSGSTNGGIIQINLPKGSNAMCLGNVSLFKDGEKEVLMQRGTIFRIDSIDIRNDKLVVRTTAVGN